MRVSLAHLALGAWVAWLVTADVATEWTSFYPSHVMHSNTGDSTHSS